MTLIEGIAEEMKEIKSRGGKIGVVGGPAIVHTGSGKYLASLIKEGYIDKINRSGSIKDAVEDGTLTGGIMYECVKNDVPFVLAGSIRDDGPLPDVITDVIDAQKLMRKYAQEVDMVLMISTMLHSIAMGNLLPSRVKSICVDINPSTVTKLSDRGSAQVVGIVTDIGTFLPLLYNALHGD